jgi:prepilin-type N-terminal cleavage/methylation domain-containing protein
MKNGRSGFTIVELLVVIAIIAILAGAITMGVNGMFYKSRLGRARAMQAMLQSGLETFYARTGEWPSPIRSLMNNAKSDEIKLTASQADECFYEIVKMSVGANAKPVIDPAGLFVAQNVDNYGCTDIHRAWDKAVKLDIVGARDHKCTGNCKRGIDLSTATKKGSSNRIMLRSMNFGYQGPNHGRFCRFIVRYYPKSDTVKVDLQPANRYWSNKYRNGFTDD